MTSEKLNSEDFIKANNRYLASWKKRGGKITSYSCGHCKKPILTPRPKKADCGPKGFWHSMKICPECGKLNFVAVYPSGKTEVKGFK